MSSHKKAMRVGVVTRRKLAELGIENGCGVRYTAVDPECDMTDFFRKKRLQAVLIADDAGLSNADIEALREKAEREMLVRTAVGKLPATSEHGLSYAETIEKAALDIIAEKNSRLRRNEDREKIYGLAAEFLEEKGVPEETAAFRYIKEGTYFIFTDDEYAGMVTALYEKVANSFGVKWTAVEKACRKAANGAGLTAKELVLNTYDAVKRKIYGQ